MRDEYEYKIPDSSVGKHVGAALAYSHALELEDWEDGFRVRARRFSATLTVRPGYSISIDDLDLSGQAYFAQSLRDYREEVMREGCPGYEGFCELERALADVWGHSFEGLKS